MYLASILIALTFMLASCHSFSNGLSAPERIEFCSLRDTNDVPIRKVHVTAFLETDLFHGMYLKDPDCPSFLIRLGADKADARARVQDFMGVVYQDAFAGRVRYLVDIAGSYVVEVEQDGRLKRRFHISDVASYEKAPEERNP